MASVRPRCGRQRPARAWLEGSSDRGPHVAMRPRGVPGGPKASPRSAPARASARAAATGSGRGTARGQLGIGRTHSPKSGKPLRSPSAFSRFRWGQGKRTTRPRGLREPAVNRRTKAAVTAGPSAGRGRRSRHAGAPRRAAVIQRVGRHRRGRRSRWGPKARSSWPRPSLMARRPRPSPPRWPVCAPGSGAADSTPSARRSR